MFEWFYYEYQANPSHVMAIAVWFIFQLVVLIWVSYWDIKKMSVTVWKMLLTSLASIVGPAIVICIFSSKELFICLFASIFIWMAIIWINVKCNKNAKIGQADIDLLAGPISVCIAATAYFLIFSDPLIRWVCIAHLWSILFQYLFIGSLLYVIGFGSYFWVKAKFKHQSFFKSIKGVKISAIPMFIPVVLMLPLNVLVML